jgi:integrase
MSEQTKAALKVLLLTGVRSQELLLAKWAHVDLDQAEWTIPVENQKLTLKQAKKASPFVIPLPEQAVALFEALKDIAGTSPWVMASKADNGHYTDKALGRAMRRLFDLKVDQGGKRVPLLRIEPASPHDLRRTMRTAMAEHLNIMPHVAEKCLNHSLGRLEGTYNHAQLFTQRREALQQWADWVELLVTDRDNVAVLHG